MAPKQLQLDLWTSLSTAQESPGDADIIQLVEILDRTIAQLPPQERLQRAGEAFIELSEIYSKKAEWLLDGNQQTLLKEAVVLQDFFDGFTRQTMAFPWDDFVEDLGDRKPWTTELDLSGRSPQSHADEFYQLELETEAKRDLAERMQKMEHEEDAAAWSRAIAHWFEVNQKETAHLLEIVADLPLSLVEVWLGALLGGFALEQRGELYDGRSVIVGWPPNKLKAKSG